MTPRLGSIHFINSLPVDLGILSGEIAFPCEIIRSTPVGLNRLIEEAKLDLSPVSTFYLAKHERELLVVPGLSISSESGVRSVLLFSRVKPEALEGKKILLTPQGESTPILLKILLEKLYGVKAHFEVAGPLNLDEVFDGDAYLLIGDEALRAYERWGALFQVLDLAEIWRAWTGCPFVFAVWTIRSAFYENHPDISLEAVKALHLSRRWALKHENVVLEEARRMTGLSLLYLRSYFRELRYDFDPDLVKGMRRYFERAREVGLLTQLPEPHRVEESALPRSRLSLADSRIQEVLDRGECGERLSVDEGALLFRSANIFELASLADRLAQRRVPGARECTTFVVDRNINYTNYCNTFCKFCAFYRVPGDPKDGYVRSLEEIFSKIDELLSIGGTQVLLQGGHHPDFGMEYYESLIGSIHERYPALTIHSLSASEIMHIAKVSHLSVREVLMRLKQVGLESLPGGGAEILVDRIRDIISPLKIKTKEWVGVHRTAHGLGMKGTATMVYGFMEKIEERMEHLDVIRKLQDETGGFRAFIPWSFEPESTELDLPRRTGEEYLRMIALSRIMLDNIPHLQAGWVTEGPKLSQVALKCGADDFGGILMEENVVTATGLPYWGVTKEDAIRLIREAGKIPCQRNTRYEILRVFHEESQASLHLTPMP